MKVLKRFKNEILIGAAASATYAISLVNDFHTDDWAVLNLLRDGFSWHDFLSMETQARFRPITNLILYARYLAFGEFAAGYYAFNILLNAFICVLLYRFLVKLGFERPLTVLSSLIFAVYFQHYEAVLWIYGIIRLLAALFWLLSLNSLFDYATSGQRKYFAVFAVFSILGLFVVEDFVVAPLGFIVFTLMMSPRGVLGRRAIPVAVTGALSLVLYFFLRTTLINQPGILEVYYYPGAHIFSQLVSYLQWMILPSPDHAYFTPLASRLPVLVYWAWKIASLGSLVLLAGVIVYLLVKTSAKIKFFLAFLLIALLPSLPLSYKVSPRNIYVPSLGLAVILGFVIYKVIAYAASRGAWKYVATFAFAAYLILNILAIDVTSLEYHRTQFVVENMLSDLRNTGLDFNKYHYVVLDHMPGRAIVGPAMLYKFHYRYEVIASNDPTGPPIDIPQAIEEIRSKSAPFIVFDYRDGHLRKLYEENVAPENGG